MSSHIQKRKYFSKEGMLIKNIRHIFKYLYIDKNLRKIAIFKMFMHKTSLQNKRLIIKNIY